MLRVANIASLFVFGAIVFYLGLRVVFDTPTSQVQSAWTTAGFVGAVVTAFNLRSALHDRAIVLTSGQNGDRLYLANDYVRVEAIRLVQMLLVAGVGLYILQATPTITAAQRHALHLKEWTPTSIIVTAALLGIVLGTVLQALLDRHTRLRFEQRTKG